MNELISSDPFLKDLENGILSALAAKVHADDTLMLAFRKNSINVYYRGGSILRLSCKNENGSYAAHFDPNYAKGSPNNLPQLPPIITDEVHCEAWLRSLPTLKEIMNGFFATHKKSEREFQQLVAWENNRSAISNETEYFITDIEHADTKQRARIDMLGLKWPSTHRKSGLRCTPVFIEMKYGIGAYDGAAGIAKHVSDLNAMLSTPDARDQFNQTIANQFNKLSRLGLVNFNKTKAFDGVQVSGTPEVIFLLSNHNPRSQKLLSTLATIEESPHFHLRFFVASFAGYGMHESCMMNLEDFKNLVGSLKMMGQPVG
jgi:hypothetical protein